MFNVLRHWGNARYHSTLTSVNIMVTIEKITGISENVEKQEPSYDAHGWETEAALLNTVCSSSIS